MYNMDYAGSSYNNVYTSINQFIIFTRITRDIYNDYKIFA